MKISLNEIRKFNQQYQTTGDIAPDGVEKLVEKVGAQLGGVDEVVELGKKYQRIIVAKVVACEKHPNADKLNVCKIDDGGKAQDVARDENGHVQVVCGAPNVREGLLVAWLPPGSTVPSTFGKDPFVLESKELRGEVSNGMLASSKELDLSDDHSGILEIDSEIPNSKFQIPRPGDDFAKAFGLDDYIIDIENKMFTHRPDLFGFLGVARELAGIQGLKFQSPDWYLEPNSKFQIPNSKQLPLQIKNELPELVPRFTAIAMSDVKVGSSPLWLQIFLAKMGQKSINNIVDYTNYFMHLTAQPLHAYDYDKLVASSEQKVASLETRKSRKGDKLKLLNGKEVTFENDSTILITSNDKPVGIGGVMGGSETEVDENTTNIVIECANFDMYSIRRTSMALGLFTDAVTRFTKGQSPLQTTAVIAKIVDEISQYAGGKVASELVDHFNEWANDAKYLEEDIPQIFVSSSFINQRLGLNLSEDEIMQLLQNVEFSDMSIKPKETLEIFAPFWRTDIEIPEDIVEEIGRLYGYDRLPQELPTRNIVPVGPDSLLKFKQRLRETLANFGANEVLTYSFVHGDLLDKVGQNKDEAYKISNALSPGLQYYRLSLTPSLLSNIHSNLKAGHDQFALFELGKTHNKTHELIDGVPKEIDTLALIVAEKDKTSAGSGSPFYAARRYLDQLADELGVELVYYPAERDPGLAMTAPFELSRSAFVTIKDSKGMLGIVGEYKQSVAKKLKLPAYCGGFEIGIKELLSQAELNSGTGYKPLSRYPGTNQDICFQVLPEVKYKDLIEVVNEALARSSLESHLEPIDIYQPESNEYKNVTLRIHLTNREHTITSDETKVNIQKIIDLVVSNLNAKII